MQCSKLFKEEILQMTDTTIDAIDEKDRQVEKITKVLERIAEEKILDVHFYDNGDYVMLCTTENGAQKVFDHYKNRKTTTGFSKNLGYWYVIIYTEI